MVKYLPLLDMHGVYSYTNRCESAHDMYAFSTLLQIPLKQDLT